MQLERQTSSLIEELVRVAPTTTTAVWGWGSTEQHGPRLPLEADTLIAEHFVNVVAAHHPMVMELPTMPFGMSRHHEAFPGTVSLSQEAAYGVAASVLRSVHRTGIRRFVVLLGHGGNKAPFHAAVAGLGREIEGLEVVEPLLGLFRPTDSELGQLIASFGEMSHAGPAEASLVYAIMEHYDYGNEVRALMRVPITDEMVTIGRHGEGTEGGDPQVFRQKFPSGAKGDQRLSDIEKGRRMLVLMEQAVLDAFDRAFGGHDQT